MAHKIGLNDIQYEPDICGAVDFCFFDDDDDVERTKGCTTSELVRNSVVVPSSSSPPPPSSHNHHHRSVIESSPSSLSSSSSLIGAKCFVVDSRSVEDISCDGSGLGKEGCTTTSSSSSGSSSSRRCLVEGHKESGEAMRNEDRASFGSSTSERGTIGSTSSLEAHEPSIQASGGAVMEHVDPNPYSSDEWEESELSDTDGDHSDSSDDDDPKSQVDRLIERGTLMYMDGENSNLSSETESSDDSSDYDDSDSESDITDVSPLISATASPLGLSPVLPRRTLGTSPLALHDNRDLVVDYRPEISSNDQGYDSQPHCNGSSHSNSDDSTDMTLLLKAVVELEKKQKRSQQNHHHHHRSSNDQYNNRHYHHHHKTHQNNHHNSHHQSSTTSPITIHPIDASPHHSHLRKASHSHRRKNMSFSNDEVRRIDRENQILLHKIMSAHTRSKNQSSSTNQNNRSVQRPANSTVNRRREEEKIRRENMILLRKIQEAKPSRDVTASRSPRHRTTHSVRPASSLPATPGSCGASARTA